MGKYAVRRPVVVQPLDKPYRFIPLTQGQIAIVDVEDFEWLSQKNWNALWSKNGKCFYARSHHIPMHRMILGLNGREEVDHRNHNTLDNRRENLRKCTHLQNCANKSFHPRNTSGFKGVTWCKRRRKWLAQLLVNRKRKYLGYFDNPEDAAKAYDEGAKKHCGEFAHVNFQG